MFAPPRAPTVPPQSLLSLYEGYVTEGTETIAKLDERIELMMQALEDRQHPHTGHWEGSWVPAEWTDAADGGRAGGAGSATAFALWLPTTGVREPTFKYRWSCCMCTNRYSHFW